MQPQSVQASGSTFSYLRAGDGPSLVLLHGIGSAARSWQAQLEGLSSRFDVIAWDAPGYGASTRLDADNPDTTDYAEALVCFLAALSIDRFHLAGHSLGALMAARFARFHAQRLHSLTLASCALGHANHAPAERERLLRSRLDDVTTLGMSAMAEKRGPRLLSAHATPAMRASVIEIMGSADPAGYRQAALMLSGGDMLADITSIDPSLPAQVLVGEDDVITPPEANKRVAQARASIDYISIADAGHAVYIEQPEAFNSAIRRIAEHVHV